MTTKTPRVGRPRSSSAAAHDHIISAVQSLLQEMTVHDLTIERIAKEAGVGKPTLYKWWDSKADLVLTMLDERVVPALEPPEGLTLEQSIRFKVHHLIDAFNGFFGRVMTGLLAEAQSDPELLAKLNENYTLARRAGTIADIQRAQAEGLFPAGIAPDIVVDAIFGSLYYHLVTRLHPLTHDYGDRLVDNVLGLTGGTTLVTSEGAPR